jgi:NitT/TauT family transport system substrate-binding protein
MNRRLSPIWLLSVLSGLFLGGCGKQETAPAASSASAEKPELTKIVLQTDWYAQPEHGGFYQALIKGYYREAGLDVEIAQGGPSLRPQQTVISGEAQFAIGRSDDIIVYVGRGIPLVMVGALMQRDPQALMYHEGSGIHGFKDLDGRNIMAVPGANFIPIVERTYNIKFSITPCDFGMSRFLADPNFIQQCFVTNEPYYVQKQGAKIGLLVLSDSGFSPYRVWYTSRKYAQEHPDVVRAFTAASIRGWKDYMEGDRSAADRRIGELNKQMLPGFIAFSVETMKARQLVSGDPAQGETYGQIRPSRIEELIRQLTTIGILTQPLKVADVFDASFLPASAVAVAEKK